MVSLSHKLTDSVECSPTLEELRADSELTKQPPVLQRYKEWTAMTAPGTGGDAKHEETRAPQVHAHTLTSDAVDSKPTETSYRYIFLSLWSR